MRIERGFIRFGNTQSAMAKDSRQSDSPSLVRPKLLLSLIVIAAIAIAIDLTGLLNLFGVETIADATTPFVVMVVGGYLGVAISDRL